MRDVSPAKTYALHIGVIVLLFALNFVLPDYHQGLFSRIMALAVFAMGYNLIFGYVGLLSLGHAMFFSAGLYGAGLTVYHLGWGMPEAFGAGVACGALLALVIGLLALRTSGVAFMIVTMMFAQVFYLLILYFAAWTGGDQGLVIQQASRVISIGGASLDLTNPTVRYMSALALFAVVLLATLAIVRSRFGRVLVAIDPRYFRPTEVELLIGDPAKAKAKLGWTHETGLDGLVSEMVAEDLKVMAHAPVMHNA